MKNHVLRPLWVAIVLVAALLTARHLYVPDDFGVNGRNFTYGFHRKGSIDDWKAFKVKYRGREYCKECHEDNYEANRNSPHSIIQCENCHGPALAHPDDPESLVVDRSRALCLRCHADLPYPGSQRGDLPAIDPDGHHPDRPCADCHNPHNPEQEG